MRLRFIAIAISVFLLVGGSLVFVLYGSSIIENPHSAKIADVENPITRENALPGTADWKIPAAQVSTTQIQAYASATSVAPGRSIDFFVSTQKNGTPYRIDIFRLGWYNGDGGRLMASFDQLVGQAQGYYVATTRTLAGCVSCLVDGKTGLLEANWKLSYKLTIPPDWTTGVYLAKFVDANNFQTYTPFDVLGSDSSMYLIVTPDTTDAAYNSWGGYSIDNVDNSLFSPKVSFDRPYIQEAGSSQVLLYEADAIHWMERQGYDLSYTSDVNLQEAPHQLLHHRAYISLGHDEYWTKEMREAVEKARDTGVGLAFLGANDVFWQMRFEPDRKGIADRTVVCYKVLTALHNLTNDPYFNMDKSRLTTQWRDPVLNKPENALVGVMYDDQNTIQVGFPWQLNWREKSALLNGSGLQPGKRYGCDIVGPRWDRVYQDSAAPALLQVLSTSPTVNKQGIGSTSNTVYYIAPSGAVVFAAGSLNWTWALDSFRLHVDPACATQGPLEPGIQKLMANVMTALVVPHSPRHLAFTSGNKSSFTIARPVELAVNDTGHMGERNA